MTNELASSRALEIHTSDIGLFKRCRRKWDWGSRIRDNRVVEDQPSNAALWLGSGVHFALEDWYGYNRFGDPRDALVAYQKAWKRSELPDMWEESLELGVGMMEHFIERWLPQRGDLIKTLWIDGEPQVEVQLYVPLDVEPPPGYDEVVYSMTFDRVGLDADDRIVVEDYKTAIREFDTARLELDPQVGSYLWGGKLRYGEAVEGACWTQFIKSVPQAPRWLKTKNRFSTDKSQKTTQALYRATLIEHYGKVPTEYIETLNEFAAMETPEGDQYIKRSVIYRNAENSVAVEKAIYEVVDEMLLAYQGQLALYPNPTRDCSWDCQFRAPCIALDDGSDYGSILESDYTQWKELKDDWRDRIVYPS